MYKDDVVPRGWVTIGCMKDKDATCEPETKDCVTGMRRWKGGRLGQQWHVGEEIRAAIFS